MEMSDEEIEKMMKKSLEKIPFEIKKIKIILGIVKQVKKVKYKFFKWFI